MIRLLSQLVSVALLLAPHLLGAQKMDTMQAVMNELLFEEASRIRRQNPDSSIYLLQLGYTNFLKTGDTINAIYALQELAETYGHQANYKRSYDELWKALLLADAGKNDVAKAAVYNRIGRYYSFYKRKEEAFKFFQLSLEIKRRLVAEKQLPEASLIGSYYAFASTYRELNEPRLAQTYLDSCFLVHSSTDSPIDYVYLQFEQAFLKGQFGENEEALEIFYQILPWVEEHNPSYLVLVYTYVGDTYRRLDNLVKSEDYYKKALSISKTYNSHIDFTPMVHGKLSDLYYSQGDYKRAYASLKTMEELDALFFDSRSANNLPLLEIQDAFRREKEKQSQLMQKQRLLELEHADRVWFLQKVILVGAIAFLLIIGVLYINYVRAKHKAEKSVIRKQREMEMQKANEVLELKNKELAASALQLIERDEFLASLKNRLRKGGGQMGPNEVKGMLRSISISNAQNWEEFRARFVAVNESFYQRLNEQFPQLSQTDQKLCALIKLNFSSKEIAKLLGITIESVHTNRYRLRKKLALTRDVNLTEFIASL